MIGIVCAFFHTEGKGFYSNHLDRVKQGVRCAYLMNAVCYGIFCPVIWFFARPIMEAFTGNPESIRRDRETLTVGDQMEETMILGLRLLCGVSRNEFRKNFGRSVEEVYGPVLEKYSRMGLLKIEGDRIALTRAGISVSNPIMADFLLDE